MRIGDLARDAGVTPKAVRYYESLGLLVPERLANGYQTSRADRCLSYCLARCVSG